MPNVHQMYDIASTQGQSTVSLSMHSHCNVHHYMSNINSWPSTHVRVHTHSEAIYREDTYLGTNKTPRTRPDIFSQHSPPSHLLSNTHCIPSTLRCGRKNPSFLPYVRKFALISSSARSSIFSLLLFPLTARASRRIVPFSSILQSAQYTSRWTSVCGCLTVTNTCFGLSSFLLFLVGDFCLSFSAPWV